MNQIINYTPQGAVPPSEAAGIQFALDMNADAVSFHLNGDETDPACCPDEPCKIRQDLTAQRVGLLAQAKTARTEVTLGQTEEPQRPTSGGSGQTSGRPVVADVASDAQIRFIRTLIAERETGQIGTYPTRTLNEIEAGSDVSKSRASSLITALRNAKKKAVEVPTSAPEIQTPATRPARTSAPERVTEDGMYRTPDGEIYKVQVAVHGSGQLYAKKLTKLDEPREMANGKVRTHEFTYETGAIRKLTPAMKLTLEEAKAWGALYGTCCVCGTMLTREESITNGIGPICGGKF